ncbi:MAG: DNA translocase FtsK [Candidatus Pacebacteria bacterium]|nr:DNA translocase FtsK [Candidatus Paceibacterota bacterium]
MAKKKSKKSSRSSRNASDKSITPSLKEGTKRTIIALLLFILAILLFFSIINHAGVAGTFFQEFFFYLFGVGFYVLPLVLILLGINYIKKIENSLPKLQVFGGTCLVLFSLALISLSHGKGGVVGQVVSWPFTTLFEPILSALVVGGLLIISIFLAFDNEPDLPTMWQRFVYFLRHPFEKRNDDTLVVVGEGDDTEEVPVPEETVTIDLKKREKEETSNAEEKQRKEKNTNDVDSSFSFGLPAHTSGFKLPPLNLLEGDKGKPNVGDIKANANIIQRTLANFGIIVEMDEVTIGPSVTRYALKPAEGVKLARIVGLQNELALALAAESIRIEAPIPGKSLVGVEVPNKAKATIGLAGMLSDERFQNSPKPLTIALGKGLSGKAVFANLAKMPHALIAGTTGSGKSVTIHSIITSLLFRNVPEDLRLIFVDPKRVELTLYNGIPHLLTPVITDAKKCILALKWAAKEMDRRYDILEGHAVRDISSYHEKIVAKHSLNKKTDDDTKAPERMPFIVIVIDELADIMQSYPRELESAIVRLAQMSRAVGIHLVLSTQRPSVNVITGLIKANVPTRIALQVSSQIDSRTILDTGGAEKLLGQGDMLYLSSETPQPERLQSAFISEDEVKRVVRFLKDQSRDTLPDEITLSGTASTDRNLMFEGVLDDTGSEDDELYEDARSIVISAGKASTSYLQRKLSVGYARAAKLIDMLEERGVVGPGSGAKPREVYEKSVEEERQGFDS